MRIDFAPMEGITGYPFRNAFEECAGGIARYFTPFINVNQNLKFGSPEERDIAMEHNRVGELVPQLLTNHADQLAWGMIELTKRGFSEVNLNLGCPSATVMKRHRGSGLLEDPEELGMLLEEAVNRCKKQGYRFDDRSYEDMISEDARSMSGIETGGRIERDPFHKTIRFSVKTRIGMMDSGRMEELVHVYNSLPLCEVEVHPRIGSQGYGGSPDLDRYERFLNMSKHAVVYNGDIRTVRDAERIQDDFPATDAIMIGRGLVADPFLAMDINDGFNKFEISPERVRELRDFHEVLFDNYREYMGEDRNAMSRMKEFWVYFGTGPYFSEVRERDKGLKEIRKAKNRSEYDAAVEKMFRSIEI